MIPTFITTRRGFNKQPIVANSCHKGKLPKINFQIEQNLSTLESGIEFVKKKVGHEQNVQIYVTKNPSN